MTDLANLDQALRIVLAEELAKAGGPESTLTSLRNGEAFLAGSWPAVALEAMRRAYAMAERKNELARQFIKGGE